ncbi:MAG: glycolate oxidase iron-sulfur subunit [Armatimonadota bacterium]|nr:MAG: glycolate oxidase iron-sulfur subunit [Armatimonadota bacterium]
MHEFRPEQLLKCIHCGLCLQSCPTYLEDSNEADSPRGRIYLMRAVSEGRIRWEAGAIEHIDRCLGCRACETACPSGVAYGLLLEIARTQVERSSARPASQRVAKRWILNLMTRPRAFAFAVRAARLFSPLFGDRAIPAPLARMLGVKEVVAKLPQVSGRRGRLASVYPAVGERRGRVGLLTGCVASVLFHDVNVATVAVLQRNGFEVVVPPGQGCCGALHVHNGFPEQARQLALRLIQCFEREAVDAIIVNSAGCGSTMKEYGRLFECTPHEARACAFADKVKDVMEFLAEVGIQVPEHALAGRDGRSDLVVTYHDACHLAHAQGIRRQPRQIIRSIPGVQLVELEEADLCCGSAGVYNLLQPEMALRLLQRKIERIRATGAEIVLTGNPGCLAWIAQGLREPPQPITVMHPVELLYRAYEPRNGT